MPSNPPEGARRLGLSRAQGPRVDVPKPGPRSVPGVRRGCRAASGRLAIAALIPQGSGVLLRTAAPKANGLRWSVFCLFLAAPRRPLSRPRGTWSPFQRLPETRFTCRTLRPLARTVRGLCSIVTGPRHPRHISSPLKHTPYPRAVPPPPPPPPLPRPGDH